jgi:hypothetical protein
MDGMQKYTLLVLVTLAASVLAGPPALAQPAQVLIIRHGEKPPERSAVNLSLKGQERAMALVPFLTKTLGLLSHGLPVALFATKIAPNDPSQCTLETLTPLSHYLKLPIQAHYVNKDYPWLAQEIMTDPAYKNMSVLICWDRRYIPRLAAALGVFPEPPTWPENVFGQVWIITYRGSQARLGNMPQRLLFGDSPH